MSDYTQDAADALVSIREAGRQVVLRRIARTINPATGASTVGSVQGGLLDVVVLTVSKGDPLDDRLTEALVAGKLRKLLVAAASAPFAPAGADLVLFKGEYWHVHGCTPLEVSTPAILYNLIVERTDIDAAAIAALALTAEEAVVAAA